jgi:uncharacterized MAPEG superfamily protein
LFLIIICIGIIVFMPLIAKVPLAFSMAKLGKYDNKHPRNQQNLLDGLGARALAAHKNCFEGICYFAPTILLVLALDEHNLYTAQLCVVFVISRLLYLFFYWFNWDKLRSLVWLIGMGTIVAHYWMLLD